MFPDAGTIAEHEAQLWRKMEYAAGQWRQYEDSKTKLEQGIRLIQAYAMAGGVMPPHLQGGAN